MAFDDWRNMIASPEIDAVAIVVRVPSHFAPTKAALYTLFAQAIRDKAIRKGESRQPTFETAVDLHRLVDAIKEASDNGREVRFE